MLSESTVRLAPKSLLLRFLLGRLKFSKSTCDIACLGFRYPKSSSSRSSFDMCSG